MRPTRIEINAPREFNHFVLPSQRVENKPFMLLQMELRLYEIPLIHENYFGDVH
jgi:hypothetical protein